MGYRFGMSGLLARAIIFAPIGTLILLFIAMAFSERYLVHSKILKRKVNIIFAWFLLIANLSPFIYLLATYVPLLFHELKS